MRPVDLDVWVAGRPRTKGNMAAGKYGGVHDTTVGLWEWVRAIQAAILEHRCNPPAQGAFAVDVTFYFKGAGRRHHLKKPDVDKLQRAVLDALTGYIWKDDCMVVEVVARKAYSGSAAEGMSLKVHELAGQLEFGENIPLAGEQLPF